MDIDWDNPENLEAVNRETGERRNFEHRSFNNAPEWYAVEDDFIGNYNCFHKNGDNEDPDKCPWDIRNKWGPPIPVDGKRPEWLEDGVPCNPRWNEDVWYGLEAPAECVSGWEIVTAIRIKPDHPYYQREAEKPAFMQLGAEAEQPKIFHYPQEMEVPTSHIAKPDPADLELRCRALGYANGDLDKAKDIHRFLKGER